MNILKWWQENEGVADEMVGEFGEAQTEEQKEQVLLKYCLSGQREEVERLVRFIDFDSEIESMITPTNIFEVLMESTGFSEEEKNHLRSAHSGGRLFLLSAQAKKADSIACDTCDLIKSHLEMILESCNAGEVNKIDLMANLELMIDSIKASQ